MQPLLRAGRKTEDVPDEDACDIRRDISKLSPSERATLGADW